MLRPLLLAHRFLGIAACLLFCVWYASGFVMTFAGMPALAIEERQRALPPLDADRVRLSPSDAIAVAKLDAPPASVRLTSLFGRPVYRLSGGRAQTVFADDGRVADGFPFDEASASLVAYLPSASTAWRLDGVLTEPDQWTLGGEYRGLRPLYRVWVDDRAGTVLYLSGITGDVVLRTTRRARAAAWGGAIPHWLYLTAFRRHAELWRWSVVGLSAVGSLVCVLGLVLLAAVQWAGERGATYRGAMRWHLWLGSTFGLTTLVWVASGMMTLDPLPLSAGGPSGAQRSAFTGGPLRWQGFTLTPSQAVRAVGAGVTIKEIEYAQVDGKPYYRIIAPPYEPVFLDGSGQRPAPFDRAVLLAASVNAMEGAGIAEFALLTRYDSYYHDRQARLPVWRVKFRDTASTWLYVDPRQGELVARIDRGARLNRWVSDGLHRLDIPFLPGSPWHEVLVFLLCGGGAALSLTAAVLSWRRLRGLM